MARMFRKIMDGYDAVLLFASFMLSMCVISCIEPPLHLPAEEALPEKPEVEIQMEAMWKIDVDWKTDWHFGWDAEDIKLWGNIDYPEPNSYEVRRYYLGEQAGGQHTADGRDGFTITGSNFRSKYQFGYYDMLLWNNIDEGLSHHTLIIDDTDVNDVTATTTATRGVTKAGGDASVMALFDQPDILYSAMEKDVHISRNLNDYDYYDEKEGVWVKHIETVLSPIVYIYLVQVVLHNNDGRITGVTGDAAISAFANATSVTTGHTSSSPCLLYVPMRMKSGVVVDGETVDIIGGKMTTFGLCDMDRYVAGGCHTYSGSLTDIDNVLLFTLTFSNGTQKTLQYTVTDQFRQQCHGGVITLHIDCGGIHPPSPGATEDDILFLPSIEDYDNVDYIIPINRNNS